MALPRIQRSAGVKRRERVGDGPETRLLLGPVHLVRERENKFGKQRKVGFEPLHQNRQTQKRAARLVDVHAEVLAKHRSLLSQQRARRVGGARDARVIHERGVFLFVVVVFVFVVVFVVVVFHHLAPERHRDQLSDRRALGEPRDRVRAEPRDDAL